MSPDRGGQGHHLTLEVTAPTILLVGTVEVSSNNSYRPVFVLGAGFSKAIADSMPTSNDLGTEVLSRLKDLGPPAEMTRGGFEEWLSRLADDQPDLEEYENLQRRSYFSLIARWIAIVIADLEKPIAERVGWPDLWLRQFLAVAHASRAIVITFNYDSLIEQAVNRSHIYDKTTIFRRKVHSCDVLEHLPRELDEADGEPCSTFRRLKLHGSTSFYWMPKDVSGSSLIRWPVQGESHDEPLRTLNNLNPILASPPIPPLVSPSGDQQAAHRERMLRGREPLIVPPTALKSRYYDIPFLRGLWQQARDAIRQASDLYLVGYSVPATDLVTVGLLRENIQPGCRVVVVNKGRDIQELTSRCRKSIFAGTDAKVLDGLTRDEWVDEIRNRGAQVACATLAHELTALAGGLGDSASRDIHIQVARADRVEAAKIGADGALSLSFVDGRPQHEEPRCTIHDLAAFARSCADNDGRILCRYANGNTGVIVSGQITAPQPRFSHEYYAILESVELD